MELVFDIETDGLLWEFTSKNIDTGKMEVHPPATKIWCIVAIDEADNVYSFDPNQIDEGIEFLKSADKLVGHNIIGFDIPMILRTRTITVAL